MRPTVREWLGPEKQRRNISRLDRIAKRCEGTRRYQLGWISGEAEARPPRRGDRVGATREELPSEGSFHTKTYHPFPPSSLIPELRPTGRAMLVVDISPGLKPRAECFHPLRIKRIAYRNAGLTLIELLVVLMIIAAISALITTSVLSALNQQNQRVCLNNMLTIEAAKDEYIRDHPGATSIDKTAFQQYFRFGIPTCPDQPGVEYTNLYSLTQSVTCSKHPQNDSKVSSSPSP